jgi:hypothetical protein
MFTRFSNDDIRVKKAMEISSFQCRYFMDVPGQGTDLPFLEDPQMRLQGWGANLQTNTVNLESDLKGMTRKSNRDYVETNDYKQNAVSSNTVKYGNHSPFVDESRTTHPVWMYRAYEPNRWENPIHNPQLNLEKGFNDNIQTRILEKDAFEGNR